MSQASIGVTLASIKRDLLGPDEPLLNSRLHLRNRSRRLGVMPIEELVNSQLDKERIYGEKQVEE